MATFTDDYSQKLWTFFMRTKDRTFQTFVDFRAAAELLAASWLHFALTMEGSMPIMLGRHIRLPMGSSTSSLC